MSENRTLTDGEVENSLIAVSDSHFFAQKLYLQFFAVFPDTALCAAHLVFAVGELESTLSLPRRRYNSTIIRTRETGWYQGRFLSI